ncbi:hypothetical protein FRC06_003677 [Ceratobasidium sp. 370]|nr:hypothetical protein FRC06_003677 [Ceratobasidium sp. 370]
MEDDPEGAKWADFALLLLPVASSGLSACDAAVMHSVAHEQHHIHHKLPLDHAHTDPIIVQNDMALPPQPHPPRPQPPRPPQTHTYTAIPGIALSQDGTTLHVGDSSTSSQRSWSTLKNVGDGSFGTVWLCDWHSPLPPGTPLSPMQCSPRVRTDWVGKRLVALKRMKRQWEGGWDECKTLQEIQSLRAIPPHPNIIPLYDCFVLPSSLELYLVFESMEGNLYQLIKSRKGKKALAGGLVTSIFQQVASALDHVHSNGYFHRDMKPENLLVTTTGLANYVSTSPVAPPNAPKEEDVFVIIKLADFGLARETESKPPYTEYVSTRWYRAPEVLLRSRDYSSPVDMWAFGTIIAELLNLRPLFPGAGEMDQLKLINDVLGDPSDAYGFDENGRRRGGGPWKRGYELGKPLGYQFPRNYPTPLSRYFTEAVPRSLIECIEDLLRYDPAERLTAKQCLSHRFLAETVPKQPVPPPLQQRVPTNAQRLPSPRSDCMTGDRAPYTGILAVSPRGLPPNHAMSPANRRPPFPNPNSYQTSMPPPQLVPSTTHRQRYYPHSAGSSYNGAAELVDQLRESELPNVPGSLEAYSGEDTADWHKGAYTLEPQDQGPAPDQNHHSPYAMDISEPAGPAPQDYPMDVTMTKPANGHQPNGGKSKLFGLKKLSSAVFGHADKLPAVAEVNNASETSLKRTQSNSTTDGKSVKDVVMPMPVVDRHAEKKQRKLELKEKRKMDEERYRARVKGMAAKREMILNDDNVAVDAWDSGRSGVYRVSAPGQPRDKGKAPMNPRGVTVPPLNTMQQLLSPPSMDPPTGAWRDPSGGWRDSTDDDHSIASSAELRRMSMATVNTVDSDPGPVRSGRQRGASIGINRATSVSSLRAAAGGGFPRSARSSASFEAFTQDFNIRATVADVAMSDAGSPHHRMGSLSPGPGGHGISHGHWGGQGGEVPQLMLNGHSGSVPARRIHPHGPMSFSSVLSPTNSDSYGNTSDAYRGSMSPGSPYETMSISPTVPPHPQGAFNLPSLFNQELQQSRQSQTLPSFSEFVAPLEHAR